MVWTMPVPGPSPLEQLASVIAGARDLPADPLLLVRTANEHFVTPHLARSIAARPLAGEEDPEFSSYLDLVDGRNRQRNALLWEQTLAVVRTLNLAGIEPLLIKGVAKLARLEEPSSSPRVLCDVDLIVPPGRAEDTHEALAGAGYVDVEAAFGPHTIGNYWKDGLVGTVDAHSRFQNRIAGLLAYEDVVGKAERRTVSDATFLLAEQDAELVLNVAHDLLHDRGILRGTANLRYLLDLLDRPAVLDGICGSAVIRNALSDRGFALALELQARMLEHLFGRACPEVGRSLAGAALHRRRIVKLRNSGVHRFEKGVRALYHRVTMQRG